jgi:chromosome segregation ATPase
MRHLTIAFALLLAGCASSAKKPVTGAVPKAVVVKEISAPKLGRVPSLAPDAQELRERLSAVTARAARAEAWSLKLSEQAKDARAKADRAFELGLVAGSAEAAELKEHAAHLQRTAEDNANQAAELFQQAQVSGAKASNLEVKVAGLESLAKAQAATNEALAGELVATRGQVGDLQEQVSGATQQVAQANAQRQAEKERADGWRKKFFIASGMLLICGVFIVAKLLR